METGEQRAVRLQVDAARRSLETAKAQLNQVRDYEPKVEAVQQTIDQAIAALEFKAAAAK